MVEIPFFTHPPKGSNVVWFDIRFEIPSFTHPPRGNNVVRSWKFKEKNYGCNIYIVFEFKIFQK